MSWKRLSRRTVYETPWMRIVEDDVINPSGGRNTYGNVQFLNRAVAIVALDEDGNTWLVGQNRYTLGEWSWELPMGGAPLDEDPGVGAARELAEETGLTASRWTQIMRLHTSNSITDEVAIVFLAQDLETGEPDFGETEDIEIRKLPFTDAVQMVDRGEITDGVSVAAILAVARLKATSSP